MRRAAMPETEKQALQSERNATSKQIGMLKKEGGRHVLY